MGNNFVFKNSPYYLPNIRMTFIKSNNWYYTPHTAKRSCRSIMSCWEFECG